MEEAKSKGHERGGGRGKRDVIVREEKLEGGGKEVVAGWRKETVRRKV